MHLDHGHRVVRLTSRRSAGRASPPPGAAPLAALLLACLPLSIPGTAPAASAQWTGAADANWATATNWTTTPPPGSGDTATFAAENNGHTAISLGTGVTVHDIAFRSTAADYVIGAGGAGHDTLTLNHGGSIAIQNDWPAGQRDAAVSANVVLGTDAGTATYSFASARSGVRLTFAGSIAGGAGGASGVKTLALSSPASYMEVNGAIGGGGGTIAVTTDGYLALTGTNTFTGTLTIGAGSVYVPTINNASAAGPLGNSAGAVTLGGDLSYGGASLTSTKKFTLSGSGRFSVAQAATTLTLGGIVDGSGMLDKSGAGTLTLTAANTYGGGTAVNSGALRLSGAGKLGNTGGFLALGGYATLDLGGTSQTVTGLWGSGGTVLNDGAGTSLLTVNTTGRSDHFAGVILDNDNAGAGKVALTVTGAGALYLSGTNGYSGATSIAGGAVVLEWDGTLGAASAGTTIGSGATLLLDDNTSCAEPVTLSGTGASGYGGALVGRNATLSGLITLAAAGAVSASNGTFHVTNAGTITGSGFGLTLTGAGNGVLQSAIGTGAAGLTKTGSGAWTLTRASTFTGATTISAGILNIQNGSALGTTAGGVTVGGGVTGATLQLQGNISVGSEPITLNGGYAYASGAAGALENVSGTNAYGGLITLVPATIQTICSDAGLLRLTHTGTISGASNLILTGAGDGSLASILGATVLSYSKSGAGTWTLTGANALTGAISVEDGTLKLSGSGKLGASSAALHVSGGKLDLGGTSQTVAQLEGGGGTILNNGGGAVTLTVNVAGGTNLDYGGLLADNDDDSGGTVALTKQGAGSLALSGLNSYSGNTLVSAGVLACAHLRALGSTAGGTTVSSGATLQLIGDCAEPVTLNGTGATGAGGALQASLAGRRTLAGLVALGSASTVTSDAGTTLDLTHTGTITGSGRALTLTGAGDGALASVIGTGAGTLTKSGTGTWTLSGANTFTGAATVGAGILRIESGAALGGTGTGSTVSSGATLQLAGGITVGAEALNVGGAGAAGAAGALVNVSGTNTCGGLLSLSAAATVSSDAGTLNLTNTGTITGSTRDLTLTGAGDGVLAGVIGTGSGDVIKSGAGTWTLTGTSTYAGRTTVEGGTLEIKTLKNVGAGSSSAGAPSTTANGTIGIGSGATGGTLKFTGTADATSNRTIDLAGTTGGAAIESSGATNSKLVLTSALTASGLGDKALTLTGTSTGANELSGAIVNSAGFKTSVLKTGTGTWTLSGPSTYTGNTDVRAGTLTLTLAFLADAADVNLASGATLNLAFAGGDTVGQLRIDGVVQSPGTWGSPASAATFRTSLLAGSGVLIVASGAAQPPFASWIAGYGITGADSDPGADPDRDGAINLAEYAYKGDPGDPTTQGLLAAFVERPTPPSGRDFRFVAAVRTGAGFGAGSGGTQTAAVDGVTYAVDGSTNLNAWDTGVLHVSGPSGTPPSGCGLQEDLGGAGWKYHTFGLDAPARSGYLRSRVSN